jgi:hypothetical protein
MCVCVAYGVCVCVWCACACLWCVWRECFTVHGAGGAHGTKGWVVGGWVGGWEGGWWWSGVGGGAAGGRAPARAGAGGSGRVRVCVPTLAGMPIPASVGAREGPARPCCRLGPAPSTSKRLVVPHPPSTGPGSTCRAICTAGRSTGPTHPAALLCLSPPPPSPAEAHLGRCLAHLDQVALHLLHHRVEQLLRVLRLAHCTGRRGGWAWGIGRSGSSWRWAGGGPGRHARPEVCGAPGVPHADADAMPPTHVGDRRLDEPRDASEQVGLHDHGAAAVGGVRGPLCGLEACGSALSRGRLGARRLRAGSRAGACVRGGYTTGARRQPRRTGRREERGGRRGGAAGRGRARGARGAVHRGGHGGLVRVGGPGGRPNLQQWTYHTRSGLPWVADSKPQSLDQLMRAAL